jgi:hypothetical protein
MSAWLQTFAALSLGAAVCCAMRIAFDETRRPQSMAVMNIVWPINALYARPIALWAYHAGGRAAPSGAPSRAEKDRQHAASEEHGVRSPGFGQVAKGATHCGARCALGDIIARGVKEAM